MAAKYIAFALCAIILSAQAAPDVSQEDSAIVQVKEGLDSFLVDYLESDFKHLMEKFFWDKQLRADELIAMDRPAPGYALKAMSNLAATFEYTKYVVRKKAMQSIKSNLFENAQAAKELKLNNGKVLALDSDVASLIVKRANLRAMADGFNLLASPWRIMFWYIQFYIIQAPAREIPEELSEMAKDVYIERYNFGLTAARIYWSFTRQLESYCQKQGLDYSASYEPIRAALDKYIDESVGCPECSQLNKPDEDTYDTYPMFRNPEEVSKLIETEVDSTLLTSISESDAACEDEVQEFDEEQLAEVQEEDIDQQMEEFVEESQLERE